MYHKKMVQHIIINGAMRSKNILISILLLVIAVILVWWYVHISTTNPKDSDYLTLIAVGIVLSAGTAVGFTVKK